MDRFSGLWLTWLPALLLMLAALVPGIVLAHGAHDGPVQTFTQAVGPYELAITIEKPPDVPAPLYIDVVPQGELPNTRLSFRLAPQGRAFGEAAQAALTTIPGPPMIYTADLPLDQLGDWELEVRADGPRGSGVARIPFSVVRRTLPLLSPLSATLAALLGFLICGAVVQALAPRLGRPAPPWLLRIFTQCAFACLIAALVLGAQLGGLTGGGTPAASSDPAAALVSYGRPHVNVQLLSEPAQPVASQPLTLTLLLSDGSTGLPVDDLDTHHDALMHLVVVSADGGYFAHLHPARLAAGRFVIRLIPDRPGRYRAYVEVVRRDSGTQLVARDLEVSGRDTGAAPFAGAGLGVRSLGAIQVTVTSAQPPQAGRQTTLTFSFSKDGRPLSDMQPWLGMAGHLLARSSDGSVFSHVHAAEAMAPLGREGVGAHYGPSIRFAYTFPQPGSYQVWAQFQHDNSILTVPLLIEVT